MQLQAGERDALGTAVLASVLLHALLLSALPGWRGAQRSPEPALIVARVVVAEPEHAPPPPTRAEPAARIAPPKRAQAPRAPAIAQDAVVSATRATAAETDARQEPTEAPALEPTAELTKPGPAAPTPTPAPPAEGGTLAQYRLAVIALAKGFNRYPRIAIENNWQGRVEVRLTVAADGAIASIGLRRGSGHEVLDRQALDMIGRAAPQVPLPAALRGREFALDIPVIFSLRDAED